jgi:translation initiation factor 1
MSGLFAGTPLERPVTCAVCEKPLEECACPRDGEGNVLLPKDQALVVRKAKRRKGKVVTVIEGLDPVASDLPAILKKLKGACAAGGTIGDDGATLEVQGEHREKAVAILREMGYPAKVAGG